MLQFAYYLLTLMVLMYTWQSIDLASIPRAYHPWLTQEGNLTQKLREVPVAHELVLLAQDYTLLDPVESHLLAQEESQGLVRIISHQLSSIPVIYARTVISASLYQAWADTLDNLGTAPIGETLLYKNQEIIRSEFEYGTVTANSILQPSNHLDEILYARRSVFSHPDGKILMTEIFLPAIINYVLE